MIMSHVPFYPRLTPLTPPPGYLPWCWSWGLGSGLWHETLSCSASTSETNSHANGNEYWSPSQALPSQSSPWRAEWYLATPTPSPTESLFHAGLRESTSVRVFWGLWCYKDSIYQVNFDENRCKIVHIPEIWQQQHQDGLPPDLRNMYKAKFHEGKKQTEANIVQWLLLVLWGLYYVFKLVGRE